MPLTRFLMSQICLLTLFRKIIKILAKVSEFTGFFLYYLQYGFVNYALQLLVMREFGKETWEKIK